MHHYDYTYAAFIQSISSIILLFVLFLVGFGLPTSSPSLFKINAAFLLFVFLGLLTYVAITGNTSFNARHIFDTENMASYQGFSRSFFVVALLLTATIKKIYLKSLILIISIFSLFVLGARSELVAFMITVAVGLSLAGINSVRYFFLIGAIGLSLFAVGLSASEWIMDSRQSELLNLESSSSWQKRLELQKIAWEQIKQSPVLGVFGGHATEVSTGGYAHNALSAWVNYGIIGFSIYIGLTLIPMINSSWKIVSNGLKSSLWNTCFLLSTSSFILIVGAKSVFWPIPALAWGIYAQALWRKHREH